MVKIEERFLLRKINDNEIEQAIFESLQKIKD